MVKNFLIIADLGAAGNLVRNILLLSDEVDFPLETNRKQTVLNQFKKDLSQWLPAEFRLRFWTKYYGVDLSDSLDWDAYNNSQAFKDKPVVFLNHSAFWESKLPDIMTSLIVKPTTELGFKWQVRSYCEKKGLEQLHNFSFNEDVESSKAQYIKEHGLDSYYKFNVLNFYEISKLRQQEFNSIPVLPLELLISKQVQKVCHILEDVFSVKLPINDVAEVLAAWNDCHWSVEQTEDWKYFQ